MGEKVVIDGKTYEINAEDHESNTMLGEIKEIDKKINERTAEAVKLHGVKEYLVSKIAKNLNVKSNTGE